MKSLTNSVLPVLLLLIMAACQSQKTILNSWMGHSKQDLIMKWGPPARYTSDGGNGEILVYAKQVYLPPSSSSFYTPGTVTTSYDQGLNYYDYTFFYVNTNGNIYHWLTQRQSIPPQQIDLTVYHR